MIICGDSLKVMPGLPDESVDLIVTDPPYGLRFMGKAWDKAVPSVDIWRECVRVLKPGAFAFVMSIPRMDCLSEMGRRLAEAGFEIGFTPIFWAYASGFPKAMNMGKAVDKRNARRAQEYQALAEYLVQQRAIKGLSQKDVAQHFPSRTGGLTGCVWNWENAMNVPTAEQWPILKELLHLDNRFDELIDRTEAEREVIGKGKCGKTAFMGGLQGIETTNGKYDFTAPATPEAQALDGSYAGFQPKPAVEVVIVAMKPLAHGTYIDQALDNAKGVTWLDDGRIPYKSQEDKYKTVIGKTYDTLPLDPSRGWNPNAIQRRYLCRDAGRFPANLLVSDDVVDDGRVTRAGKAGFHPRNGGKIYGRASYFESVTEHHGGFEYGDSGSFSRYFSLDAWFDEKLKELPESVRRTFPFLVVPKAGKSEKWFLCRVCDDVWHSSSKDEHDEHNTRCLTCTVNFNRNDEGQKKAHKGHKTETNILMHPTQKPVKLFAYLITLGSRPGDVVADFFGGVGTMGVAAKILRRDWLMIEWKEEWCRIGKRRVEATDARLV